MSKQYRIEFKPQALKDMKLLDKQVARRIAGRIKELSGNLKGNVKRLRKHDHDYRLRVGSWRILFDVKDDLISIYRIRHRRDVYR